MTELDRLAGDIYDRHLNKGRASKAEIHAELVAALSDGAARRLSDEIISAAAWRSVEKADASRTAESQQGDLFESLDRAVPMGNGIRVVRRHMTLPDWSRHLGHISENAARVNASASKENRRFTALVPYLTEGMDTEQSVKAWTEANPGQVLP